jgi:methyl-accepting chemotaxis protein
MGSAPLFSGRGQSIMKLNSLKTKFLAAFLPIFQGSFLVFYGISY